MIAERLRVAFDENAPAAARGEAFMAVVDAVAGDDRIGYLALGLGSRAFVLRHIAMHAAIAAARGEPEALRLVKEYFESFSADRDTQFAAALVMGSDGLPFLEKFFVEESDAPASKRLLALRAVIIGAKAELRVGLLKRALVSGADELVAFAIPELAAAGYRFRALELREAVGGGGAETALAAVRVLAELGGRASELVLVEMLARAPRGAETAVQIAVLAALERAGTMRAAESVRELEARSADPRVVGAARRVLAAVKDRVGETRGGLSIAEDELSEGALSFTEGEGGRLSFAERDGESGKLSLVEELRGRLGFTKKKS